MPRVESVTCDDCGQDLTSTTNCVGWRIGLLNEPILSRPSSGLDFVTAMHVSPSLAHDHYFCNLHCLAHWLKGQSMGVG